MKKGYKEEKSERKKGERVQSEEEEDFKVKLL